VFPVQVGERKHVVLIGEYLREEVVYLYELETLTPICIKSSGGVALSLPKGAKYL
jgi:hypothetical protein